MVCPRTVQDMVGGGRGAWTVIQSDFGQTAPVGFSYLFKQLFPFETSLVFTFSEVTQ